MAGLYVTFCDSSRERLEAVASRMRLANEAQASFVDGIGYAWLSHDSMERYAPAVDVASGVRCIVGGRLSWSLATWQQAERMPYKGGTANRVLLDRYLKNGAAAITPYNGAATVLIWDPREQVAHIWTDQFGYHPAFVYGDQAEAPKVFTTFPDAVVSDPGIEVAADVVSMVEFIRAWRVTPPHTYYEDLKHAGAATYWRIDLRSGAASKRVYWKPFEDEFFRTLPEAASALADALKVSIDERTSVSERSVFFVSGGADSRVMLYAAHDRTRVWGLNLYERPTAESAVAKALCDRAGAHHVGFGRDNDYYPRMHADNVRWSGAMWSAEDNHYLGVRDVVTKIGADMVMTACTTDWMFKGYGLEKDYRKFMGRNLPISRFADRRVDGFLPNHPLLAPPEFAEAVDARMQAWFRGTPERLHTDRDRLLVEDRRTRPACYTVSVSGQIMYRTYPYDTFLADSRLADCYSRMPARWKLNGKAWGLAAGMICCEAADIVDSNFGWTMGSSTPKKLVQFAKGWAKRRINSAPRSTMDGDRPPSHASWPDMGWYALHSVQLRKFWDETPQGHRDQLTRLVGFDPWKAGLSGWSREPATMMRLITLLQHWRQIP